MAVTVNMHEAKTQLSRLVERARSGEEVIIAKAGEPVVRLVPVRRPAKPRAPGSAAGRLRVAPDFHEPLPPDVVEGFER